MAKVHILLQGKGGVGKSMVAAWIAQELTEKGAAPFCIDTDPVNSTFYGYKSLNVARLELMEDNDINPRAFDTMIEMIVKAEGDVVIDNGAASFVPLAHFIISNNIPDLLKQYGHELIIHTVITGGQALLDTVSGFSQLAQQLPVDTPFIVWLNPFWGPIEDGGKSFQDMKAYKTNKDRITAIVQIPKLKKETAGRDLSEMLQARMTFKEAISSPDSSVMTKHRLEILKGNLSFEMENAVIF